LNVGINFAGQLSDNLSLSHRASGEKDIVNEQKANSNIQISASYRFPNFNSTINGTCGLLQYRSNQFEPSDSNILLSVYLTLPVFFYLDYHRPTY